MTPWSEELVIYEARSFLERLRGLLFRSELTGSEALHIFPCKNVHTYGMQYDLDIVLLSDTKEVLKIVYLKPNKSTMCTNASSVLELKAGNAQNHGLLVGSVLSPFRTRSMKDRHG